MVVNNNASLQQTKSVVDASYGGNPEAKGRGLWVFRETNFAKIAEDMGCLGLRVERPGDLRSALDLELLLATGTDVGEYGHVCVLQ